jgi:integrase/recombinase XerD
VCFLHTVRIDAKIRPGSTDEAVKKDLLFYSSCHWHRISFGPVPSSIAQAGESATRRFTEFFTAAIRNKNTRLAYARAVRSFFTWCEQRRITLDSIQPAIVAGYVEELGTRCSKPTVKQHLAAIRMLFDWLVLGQVVPFSPANPVRGPRHVVARGKTPVLSAREARQLLDSIDTTTLVGLRDRALIGVMLYSFARVSAAISMNVEDYFQEGEKWWFRLHEKAGKRHEVPTHRNAQAYLDAYLQSACITLDKKGALFRSLERTGTRTATRLTRNGALRMIKRRARAAQLPENISCHTLRATGITTYLQNGGTIANAQAIAAHESPRTTKLYDRTENDISLDEIERVVI